MRERARCGRDQEAVSKHAREAVEMAQGHEQAAPAAEIRTHPPPVTHDGAPAFVQGGEQPQGRRDDEQVAGDRSARPRHRVHQAVAEIAAVAAARPLPFSGHVRRTGVG